MAIVEKDSQKLQKRSRFYVWLSKQSERDDPIGDLSRDAVGDKKFPIESDVIQKLRFHLVSRRACSEAVQALEEAYTEFKSTARQRKGIPVSVRFDVFRRDDYCCQICGSTANDSRLEVDHKIPISKNGSNEIENLWTLCFACNRGKGAKDL